MKKLSILGEFNPSSETHTATNDAIEHSKKGLGIDLKVDWVSTDEISENLLKSYSGYLVAPGSPYKSMAKALFAIEYARENKIPILGTCGGFQHMIIEYARNVLGHKNAQHAEYDPSAAELFISELSCSLRGREMDLSIMPNSKVASLYGKLKVKEEYYCNFGVNPKYIDFLKKGPVRFVGSDGEGELRILEYPEHPFFVGTLFVPQTQSTEDKPHPLLTGFLKAIMVHTV
jgi:CTP synthase (UTP-ammonia lyase)